MALERNNPTTYTPPSLAQYFSPPENFVGSFGWICGYSADPNFLNLSAELFTGKPKQLRAQLGQINMVLMLDPGYPQISLIDTPGIYHAGKHLSKHLPFRLLHAKVALLHFKKSDNPNAYILRLIVSTGNWTSETLSESLDLVCCLDFSSNDLRSTDSSMRQIRADILSAWNFMVWLREYFSFSIVNAHSTSNRISETQIVYNELENIMGALQKPRGYSPRFFDNRNTSLLHQLPDLIKNNGKPVARNYLVIGSGFYQAPTIPSKSPSVIRSLLEILRKANLVTRTVEKEVVVNPKSCQAIATSIDCLNAEGWIIREANDPLNKKRNLHAKFIFSTNFRDNSNSCSSSWLYLGSGNITEPGFANRISKEGGNLEAGLVLFPNKLFWRAERNIDPSHCIEKLLPLQWDRDLNDKTQSLYAGEGLPDRKEEFVAPPFSWFLWIPKEENGVLQLGVEYASEIKIRDPKESFCVKASDGLWIWEGKQPAEVTVMWGPDFKYSSLIPVIDSFGRIAGKHLQSTGLEEAWWQLAGYPNLLSEQDQEDEEYEYQDTTSENNLKKRAVVTKSYPIRDMMEFIEKIADKQTMISEREWKFWCNRLEQILIQTQDSIVYQQFKLMDLNPFSSLRNDAFVPAYVNDKASDNWKYYNAVLEHIEEVLELKNCKNL